MDFESTGNNIARGSARFPMGTTSSESPPMDLPSRQRSPFLQSQHSQQKSPFISSRNNSPFLPSQRNSSLNNPLDLTGGPDADGMDTSPDSHSGTGDHATPSTQQSHQAAPSSRTSTSYSPHPRPDDSLSRSTHPAPGPGPEHFSAGGAGIFGTRQEFEDFTAQLYTTPPPPHNTSHVRGGDGGGGGGGNPDTDSNPGGGAPPPPPQPQDDGAAAFAG
ncbi:MAG: hypothetical protein Q9157_007974, partial [Trypethelium eluteriae]